MVCGILCFIYSGISIVMVNGCSVSLDKICIGLCNLIHILYFMKMKLDYFNLFPI